MAKILIINGHQKVGGKGGRLNATLAQVAEKFFLSRKDEVKKTAVDADYGVEEEVGKFLWADIVVHITPVYWMSVPWLFKKYIDEVFSAGHGKMRSGDGRSAELPEKNYGRGGLLKAKYMLVTTWNAPRGAFSDKKEFFEGKTVDDVFFHFHKCQEFCGMARLPSFSCHDVVKNPKINDDLKAFERHLKAVFD